MIDNKTEIINENYKMK